MMNLQGTRTLREEMDARREKSDRFNMRTVVAMMVPFITELADRHAEGESLFVYPGAILYRPSGAQLIEENAHVMPGEARDRACLAPEQRQGTEGDARSSVFAIGAILYELMVGQPVGPGMRRPSEVAKGVPQAFEMLLSKALVGDRNARPGDLGALAQALHHCAPMASIPPPAADESHLDHDEGFEVDVSLSMIPPAAPGSGKPRAPGEGAVVVIPKMAAVPAVDGPPPSSRGSFEGRPSPYDSGVTPPSQKSTTSLLADMKASLEADPRPRYVVIKDGMDHGPFSAVELLQQIATGSFREEHFLRDVLSKDERQIADWEQFAPFAQQARLTRAVDTERKQLDATVQKERHSTQNKALIGGGALLLVAAVAAGWWAQKRSNERVRIGVSMDEAQFIDFEGGLEGKKAGDPTKPGGGSWAGSRPTNPGSGDDDSSPSPGGGPPPQIAGGGSCEGARAAYVEDYTKRGVPPDLGAGAFGSLNTGSYLNSCGVPPSMSVSICAAVQNGRAVGVTVRTNPSNGGVAGCVRSQVFGMSFPAHPRMDIATTHFAAE
jgi:eukaryotic-like serine/threonine-protein kinase